MTTIIEAGSIAVFSVLLLLFAIFEPSDASFAALIVGAATILCIWIINPRRWQIYPALFVVLAIAAATVFGLRFDGLAAYALLAAGLVMLFLSAALLTAMPIRRLPVPAGPYAVGSHRLGLVRPPEQVDGGSASQQDRSLHVKVWYPAAPAFNPDAYQQESLWEEYYSGKGFPPILRFLTGYLRKIRTHTFKNAPFAKGNGRFPLVLYNHAAISIASENTLLMEALAAQGYVVIGVRHAEQDKEYAELRKNVSEQEKASDREIFRKLTSNISRAERSALMSQLYELSSAMPVIVRRRAADTIFILDHIDEVLSQIPESESTGTFDPTNITALGLSLGGAVSTVLGQTDDRIGRIVNMDGGLFGVDPAQPVTQPYLMLYSGLNVGGNDDILRQSADRLEEQIFEGAKHLDFHDATLVLPGLNWFGLLGQLRGERIVSERNNAVLRFVGPAERYDSITPG